jgi:hypothetical protein
MRNMPIWRVPKGILEIDQNAGTACCSPIEIADGSLRSRRYGGSNYAELELFSRNQDSGTGRDKRSYSVSTEECHHD